MLSKKKKKKQSIFYGHFLAQTLKNHKTTNFKPKFISYSSTSL